MRWSSVEKGSKRIMGRGEYSRYVKIKSVASCPDSAFRGRREELNWGSSATSG